MNIEGQTPMQEIQDGRKKNWFWDYNDVFGSSLTPNAKLLRLCLAHFAENETRKAWPSLARLARETGLSVATIKRALNELEETGWIERTTRKLENEAYASTIYIVKEPPTRTENKEGGWLTQSQPPKIFGGLAHTEPGVGSQRAKVGSQRATNYTNITIPIEQYSSLSSSNEEDKEGPFGLQDSNNESEPQKEVPASKAEAAHKEQPSPAVKNHELIAELTNRLHQLPVEKLKGHYALIGKAYNQYGYQTVMSAIEDLEIEFLAAKEMGEPLVLSEKELARRLFARCQWNAKSIERANENKDKDEGKEKNEKRYENWKLVDGQWIYDPPPLTPKQPTEPGRAQRKGSTSAAGS